MSLNINGSGQYRQMSDEVGAAQPRVVQVSITYADIAKIGTIIGGFLTAALAGGYIFMPARSTDLAAVKEAVREVRLETAKIAETVAGLQASMRSFVDRLDAPVRQNRKPLTVEPGE